MSFDPAGAFESGMAYLIHIGAGMTDQQGMHVDLTQHGPGMGGEWATAGMMSGGMGTASMMGAGWGHPSNGSYGMIFSFTTA
ncbi:MAG: hypothetical protein O2992_09910 [Gemmatimonadetes bacterium]|nr:hypothetical protein [Gemmatimonadota bacterium]